MNYQLLIDKVRSWDKPDDPPHIGYFNKQFIITHLENIRDNYGNPNARSGVASSIAYVKERLPREWLEEAK